MFQSTISAVVLAALALHFQNAAAQLPAFTLICTAYPDVCDHHEYASTCLNLGSQGSGIAGAPLTPLGFSIGSFHRDAQGGDQLANTRRSAIGCGGRTVCDAGLSCDEIPYASTYDGGLGCFSQTYSGSVNDLYNDGSVRCLTATQNSAHGSAVGTFYSASGIADSQEFILILSVPPPSSWTYQMHTAINAYYAAATAAERTTIGQQIIGYCLSFARVPGSQQQIVTTSAYTQRPGGNCPSRGYRKRSESSRLDRSESEFDGFNRTLTPVVDGARVLERLAGRQTVVTAGGHHLRSLYGHNVNASNLRVWVHDEEDVEKGEWHTVVGNYTMGDSVRAAEFSA